MVVPKSGGCCCGPVKAPTKKSAPKATTTKSTSTTKKKPTTKSTTKKSTTKSTSSATSTKNKDEALKKRLKKVLGVDSKSTCSSGKGNLQSIERQIDNFQTNLTNGIQQFILNTAKKETNTSVAFKKINKNATKASTAKATTKSSTTATTTTTTKKPRNTAIKTSDVKKTAQSTANKNTKESTASKKSTQTTAKNSTTKSAKAPTSTTSLKKAPSSTSVKKVKLDASVKQVKSKDSVQRTSTTSSKKIASTAKTKKPATKTIDKTSSTTAVGKRKTTAAQKMDIPAKKPRKTLGTAKKVPRKPTKNCGPCDRRGGCCNNTSSSSGGCGCGTDYTTSTDFTDDDDESDESTSSYSDYSDSDDDSDSDSSGTGGCYGGACGRPPKSMNGKGRGSRGSGKRKDTSGSWETQSDSNYDQVDTKEANLENVTSLAGKSANYSEFSGNAGEKKQDLKGKSIKKIIKNTKNSENKDLKHGNEQRKEKSSTLSKPQTSRSESSTGPSDGVILSNKKAEISVSAKTDNVVHKESKSTKITASKNIMDDVERKQSKMINKKSKQNITNESKSFDSKDIKSTVKFKETKPNLGSLVPYGQNGDVNGEDSTMEIGSDDEATLENWYGNFSTSSSDYTYDGDHLEEIDSSDSDSNAENWYDAESSEELEFTDNDEDRVTDTNSTKGSESSLNMYDSSMDEDYKLPENVEEDILIRRGEAKIYDATGYVDFDSDDSSPQIFELPNEIDSENHDEESNQNNLTFVGGSLEKSFSSDSEKSSGSCPKLVPIDMKNDNIASDDFMEYSSDTDYESSDSSGDDSRGPSNYEPEIINATGKHVEDLTTLNNLGLLQANIAAEIKLSNNYTSPLDVLTHTKAKFTKCNVVSVENQTMHQDSLTMQKSKTKSKSIDLSSKLNSAKRNSTKKITHTELKSSDSFAGPRVLSQTNTNLGKCRDVEIQNENQTTPKIQKSNIQCKLIPPSQKLISVEKSASEQHINKDASLMSIMETDESNSSKNILSKFYNSLNTYQVLLLLKTPINFHGTLKVKLISGALNVLGYNFKVGESQEVFSPRGNNLISLTPMPTTAKETGDIVNSLSAFTENFMQADINDIMKEYDASSDAIVLLERNFSKKVDMIRKYMKENVFPSFSVERSNPYYRSECILRCRFYIDCFNSFQCNPQWNSLRVSADTVLMVIGGKGVGKSTYLRYIINSNLQKFGQFLFIDLDIGQPEISAPQTVSATLINKPLLGPGYFYDLTPFKNYLYGDINVVLSPITYLKCVHLLLDACNQENRFSHIPWVVNTMGYNKGFGAELLSVIIESLLPTHVVQLNSPKEYNNFDYPMSAETVRNIPRNIYIDEQKVDIFDYEFIQYESVVPSEKTEKWHEWIMKPKEMRLTMILSQMGDILSDRDDWLTDVRPYRVSLDDLKIVCFNEENISKAELLDVINANLVYLCETLHTGYECFGIGIVRGVDKFHQTLYLLSSVPPKVLCSVNTIAVCNIPLPASVLLNQGPKIKGAVPYTYNTHDMMTSKHVPESIYRPLNYLQGARNILLDE